jgi:hypothetical protein
VAAGIHAVSRRNPVTASTVNDLPVPQPVPVLHRAAA